MATPTAEITRPPVPPRTAPPWTRQGIGLIALVMVTIAGLVASWRYIGMGVLPLITGIGNIFKFVGSTLPPDFYDFPHTLDQALITVCMAVAGTALAAVLGLIVGFLAARNTTPHPAVRWVARGLIVLCRSIPDLVFAIIFVEAIGVGVLPGVLALGFHSIGMLGKLYAEAIEQVPQQPREAVAATGAGRLQNLATSVWPQVMPAFSSITLYRLDINLRSSVILGYVGAGGIGFLLNQDMGVLLFKRAVGIVLVIFVLIVLMEYVSAIIRRSLIGEDAPAISGRAGRPAAPPLPRWLTAAMPRPRRELVEDGAVAGEVNAAVGRAGFDRAGFGGAGFGGAGFGNTSLGSKGIDNTGFDSTGARRDLTRPPWTAARIQQNAFAVGAVLLVIASLWIAKINPITAVTDVRQIWDTFTLYFPPDFSTDRAGLISGTLQTIAVAVVATVVGLALALPIGLAASRNVAGKWLYRITRGFLVIVRAVPELILAIVFVVAVGLGLVAGTFALIVGTVGFLSKLVADGIEEVNPVPREAVLSAGAAKLQETVTSVILPAAPTLVGNSMYMLDVNFRSSSILGLVGGGGIGFILFQSIQVLAYRTTGAIIISTFAVVLLIEILTNWLRKLVI
ncbi:MAG TPA: phosphonate ABC transporter, permease protein PhnE [Trebonia sp.]|nr:phosphonate ABC transporter, permease protein PhnE [Trebonia sp.]